MSIWRTSIFVAAVVAVATAALYAFGPPDLRWKIVSALPEALRGPKAYVLLEIDQATLREEALGGASGAVRDALNSATPLVPFRDLHDEAGALRVQIVDLADAPRALVSVQAALAPSG